MTEKTSGYIQMSFVVQQRFYERLPQTMKIL